jgi:hypothetical protein
VADKPSEQGQNLLTLGGLTINPSIIAAIPGFYVQIAQQIRKSIADQTKNKGKT